MKITYGEKLRINSLEKIKYLGGGIENYYQYHGTTDGLLMPEDAIEYGLDFIPEKYKYNSVDRLSLFKKDNLDEVGYDVSDIEQARNTFFPTLSSEEEENPSLTYYGSVVISEQTLYMMFCPPGFNKIELYEEVTSETPCITITFEKDYEISSSKVYWILISPGGKVIDINLSYKAASLNINPFRNLHEIFLRNDDLGEEPKITKKLSDDLIFDNNSGVILGNKKVTDHPILDYRESLLFSYNVSSNFEELSPKFYHKGELVYWKGYLWRSVIDNNPNYSGIVFVDPSSKEDLWEYIGDNYNGNDAINYSDSKPQEFNSGDVILCEGSYFRSRINNNFNYTSFTVKYPDYPDDTWVLDKIDLPVYGGPDTGLSKKFTIIKREPRSTKYKVKRKYQCILAENNAYLSTTDNATFLIGKREKFGGRYGNTTSYWLRKISNDWQSISKDNITYYSPNISYNKGDKVIWDNDIWVSLVSNNVGHENPSISSDWIISWRYNWKENNTFIMQGYPVDDTLVDSENKKVEVTNKNITTRISIRPGYIFDKINLDGQTKLNTYYSLDYSDNPIDAGFIDSNKYSIFMHGSDYSGYKSFIPYDSSIWEEKFRTINFVSKKVVDYIPVRLYYIIGDSINYFGMGSNSVFDPDYSKIFISSSEYTNTLSVGSSIVKGDNEYHGVGLFDIPCCEPFKDFSFKYTYRRLGVYKVLGIDSYYVPMDVYDDSVKIIEEETTEYPYTLPGEDQTSESLADYISEYTSYGDTVFYNKDISYTEDFKEGSVTVKGSIEKNGFPIVIFRISHITQELNIVEYIGVELEGTRLLLDGQSMLRFSLKNSNYTGVSINIPVGNADNSVVFRKNGNIENIVGSVSSNNGEVRFSVYSGVVKIVYDSNNDLYYITSENSDLFTDPVNIKLIAV